MKRPATVLMILLLTACSNLSVRAGCELRSIEGHKYHHCSAKKLVWVEGRF